MTEIKDQGQKTEKGVQQLGGKPKPKEGPKILDGRRGEKGTEIKSVHNHE